MSFIGAGVWTVEWNPERTAWAAFSDDRRYRWALGRIFTRPCRRWVLFVMLNPSTADALKDDATIRRCTRFTKDWGYDGFIVANLYAYRATHPKDLFKLEPRDRVGVPWCNTAVRGFARNAALVVCAWGANAEKEPARWQKVYHLIKEVRQDVWCLGTTEDGHPKHPLRLPATTQPTEFLP